MQGVPYKHAFGEQQRLRLSAQVSYLRQECQAAVPGPLTLTLGWPQGDGTAELHPDGTATKLHQRHCVYRVEIEFDYVGGLNASADALESTSLNCRSIQIPRAPETLV